MLDDNFLSVLNGDSDETVEIDNSMDFCQTNDDTNCNTGEVDVDVDSGIGAKSTKVKKVRVHKAACHDLLSKDKEKMAAMNLPVVRYRKNCMLKRNQTAISNSVYNNMMNTNKNSLCNDLINEIMHESDGTMFGTWDRQLNELV